MDVDEGDKLIENLDKVMAEGLADDRDELIASFDQLLISMFVSLDPSDDFTFTKYSFDSFTADVIKVKPEVIEQLTQP